MKHITLTDEWGDKVYININHIVAINERSNSPDYSNYNDILLSGEHSVLVQETIKEILEIIS